MKTRTKTVLVAGAQGVIGRAAAEHFSKEADTTVYAVSRRPVVGLENVHPISADLLDPADTRTKLEALKEVTHVIFGAYVEKDTPTERSSVNVALLRNLMDAVEESAPNLQHVTIYQGGKAYGGDLGPFSRRPMSRWWPGDSATSSSIRVSTISPPRSRPAVPDSTIASIPKTCFRTSSMTCAKNVSSLGFRSPR